jgi:hypothetical protein
MDYIDKYMVSRGTLESKKRFEELAKQSTVLFAKAQAVGLIKNNKQNNGTTTLPSNGKDIDSLLTSARG